MSITIKLDLTEEEWNQLRVDGRANASEELRRILNAVEGDPPPKTEKEWVQAKEESVLATDTGKQVTPNRTSKSTK